MLYLFDTLSCSAHFYPTYCYFQNIQTQKIIGCGKSIGGLDILTMEDTVVSDSNNHQVLSAKVDDRHQIWLWHGRLGHPSFSYMKHLFPSLFRTCSDSEFKCETCVMAKSHLASFPISDSKATLPFDLIHSDVWGPAKVTSNGFRWFVTFIGDCTRLTWVFLMKNKSDVPLLLQEFCAMVSTQFQTKVKVFRSDNGGEYVNHTLACFFCDQGIIHQTTTLFTPQQNGVSKRKNREIMEVARSLLLDKCVPNHLCGHAVLADVYLINCVPSRVLDFQTPLDVLQKHVSLVSVSKLHPKVFECIVYVHVYSHQGSKLGACAIDVYLLGMLTIRKVISVIILRLRKLILPWMSLSTRKLRILCSLHPTLHFRGRGGAKCRFEMMIWMVCYRQSWGHNLLCCVILIIWL